MKFALKLIPWLLAVIYFGFAMRGAEHGPAAPDGGQHAMNGALICDYLRTAAGSSPITFAQSYLVHYPAISVGYHPPLFHVVEAGFYSVFGVSPQTARLTVAVFAALSVVLLYHLVRRTHESDWFAALCVIAFCSLQLVQQAATDVMLEFPSLFFVLLALHCLVGFQDGFRWQAALAFAVISAAAIWTKQHTVFLGLIPFLMVVTCGRFQELLRFPLWGGALVFGAACLLLAAFMGLVVGDDYKATSQIPDAGWAQYVLIRNVTYYAWRLRLFFGLSTMLATLAACLGYLVLRLRQDPRVKPLALYAAWAVSVLPVPLIAWMNDERYLFAGFPAYVVLLCGMMWLAAEKLLGESKARWATILATALLFASHVNDDATHAAGPFEAAEYVWQQKPKRVLICGRGEYQFIFKIRCLDGGQPSLVILRGSKVPPESLRTEAFDQFAHDYGLEYVVIGDDWNAWRRRDSDVRRAYPWDPILNQPSEHMELEKKLQMSNTFRFMEGDMLVYRFTKPSSNPRNVLGLRMGILGRDLEVDLDNSPSATAP